MSPRPRPAAPNEPSRHRRRGPGGPAVLLALVLVGAGMSGVGTGAGAAPATVVDEVLAGHTMSGEAIPCVTRTDGIRVCHGDMGGNGQPDLRLVSFDGIPLEAWVSLPPAPADTPDGAYPLVVQSHGWGMPPTGPDDEQYGGLTAATLAAKGYATLQFSARGWGQSCGTARSRQASPTACAEGYLRLDDYRYEIRDIQNAIGLLVDEGLADPTRIGVTGESYGAGASLAVATLNDRIMLPDGTVEPWRSPAGHPLRIAGAAPLAGWSDLVTALLPNGRTFDGEVTDPATNLEPIGVWKQSIGTLLYAAGSLMGHYAPAGANPEADITGWFAVMERGEPYDQPEHAYITEQMARYRSPYHLLAGTYGVPTAAPAPMMLTAGFTDAIFPADEYLRYYDRVRADHPDTPISLFFYDGGHQRGQNKPADRALLVQHLEAFLDQYVAGTGHDAATGVTVLGQTCGADQPSDGPHQAATFEALRHHTRIHQGGPTAQQIDSTVGDQAVADAFEPLTGGLACTTAPATDQGEGVGTWRLEPAEANGFTLVGSPEITAHLDLNGQHAYLAARLLDVDPLTGTEVLVTRGVYRIDPDGSGRTHRFSLHPNVWHFAAGHVPKLELLGQDAPYLRPANGAFTVEVTDLVLALPSREPEPTGPTGPTGTVPASTVPPGHPGAPTTPTPAAPTPAVAVRAQPAYTG